MTSSHDAAPAGAPEPGPAPVGRWRRIYGAGPWHLLGHLLLIAVAAFALSIMFRARFAPEPLNLVLWLLGGAVLHDLVLLPLYSAVNAGLARVLPASDPAAINFLRVPAVLSVVVLITFWPRIANRQPGNFERALGEAPPDYLSRWLLVTAALFAASAIVWLTRRVRGAGPGQGAGGDPAPASLAESRP